MFLLLLMMDLQLFKQEKVDFSNWKSNQVSGECEVFDNSGHSKKIKPKSIVLNIDSNKLNLKLSVVSNEKGFEFPEMSGQYVVHHFGDRKALVLTLPKERGISTLVIQETRTIVVFLKNEVPESFVVTHHSFTDSDIKVFLEEMKKHREYPEILGFLSDFDEDGFRILTFRAKF